MGTVMYRAGARSPGLGQEGGGKAGIMFAANRCVLFSEAKRALRSSRLGAGGNVWVMYIASGLCCVRERFGREVSHKTPPLLGWGIFFKASGDEFGYFARPYNKVFIGIYMVFSFLYRMFDVHAVNRNQPFDHVTCIWGNVTSRTWRSSNTARCLSKTHFTYNTSSSCSSEGDFSF